LCVEELEQRQVPSTALAYSSNWSGYAVTAGAGAVSAVSAAWTVPTASGPTQGYEASWVGIDGLNSGSVEQIGTESDFVGGQAQYYAWYEMYPSPALTIAQPIKPGDEITASVSYATSGFTLTIDAAGWSKPFTTTVQASAQRSSAEWVVEAPSSNGVLPLANVGSATFTNAQATINNNSGAINAAPGTQINQIDMVSQHSSLEDQTSALHAAGTALTVTVVASASGASSRTGGSGTSGQSAKSVNNQTASLPALPPPVFTVSPTLLLVQQFPAISAAATQINSSVATPSSPATIVQTGLWVTVFGAATAPSDNAQANGLAAPVGARQAPDGMPPAGMPPEGMPPEGTPPADAEPPQARRMDSASTVTFVQQAEASQDLVQNLGVFVNTGPSSVKVAGGVLVLAWSGLCGIGVSEPSERPRAFSKLRRH
jgi:hypothetical protein